MQDDDGLDDGLDVLLEKDPGVGVGCSEHLAVGAGTTKDGAQNVAGPALDVSRGDASLCPDVVTGEDHHTGRQKACRETVVDNPTLLAPVCRVCKQCRERAQPTAKVEEAHFPACAGSSPDDPQQGLIFQHSKHFPPDEPQSIPSASMKNIKSSLPM